MAPRTDAEERTTGKRESDSRSVYRSEESHELDPKFEAKAAKAVLVLDCTILPVMTMFYLLSFLDRTNIGNARVAGLQKGLKLSDHQYQVSVTVTYVPYIFAELPSNLLLHKIGPNIVLPTILTVWGFIAILQGFVTNYHGLIAARFFLGLVEGPMFPGIVLYLSGFYTRRELSFRIALFFSSASLSGAFSGLLAAAINNMDGLGGKPAWAWIFILEGLFSVLCGMMSFFFVPATLNDSKFLTAEQKEIVRIRLERDRPFMKSLDSFSFKHIVDSIISPHVILMSIAYFFGGTSLFGLALFLPSIVKQLGFSANRSQLLSVGPFGAGFVFSVMMAYISDRTKRRALPLVCVSLLAVTGFAMFFATKNKHVSYAAMFLMVPGIYGKTAITAAWISNNSEPHYRRATSIALGFIATSSGGILSTWLYPTEEGPRFKKATIVNLTFTISVIVITIANAIILHYRNIYKKNHRDEILAPYATEKEPDGGVKAWVELGDRHPDFKYVI